MLVRMLDDGETYNGRYGEGDVLDLNVSVALALIKKGKAEEIENPNRELETLDNREGRVLEQPSVGLTAATRNPSPAMRAVENDPNAARRLANMRSGEGAQVDDDSETGATTKAVEGKQVELAAQDDSEDKSSRDLNEEAKQAARADAEQANRERQTAKPEESKSAEKPASGPRTPRT